MRLLCIFVCRPELYWITTRTSARNLNAFVGPASSHWNGMAQRFGLRIGKLSQELNGLQSLVYCWHSARTCNAINDIATIHL